MFSHSPPHRNKKNKTERGNLSCMSLESRFWSKVQKGPGCWLWTASTIKGRGYGKIVTAPGKWELAHRVSWRLTRGEIPIGVQVCHRCDVPGCVRPDHLFVGTQADNMADMIAKGRHRLGHTFKPKLTDDELNQIIEDSREQHVIAAEYGVHQCTVSRIKSGKARNWWRKRRAK